jgi:hypothetical protein
MRSNQLRILGEFGMGLLVIILAVVFYWQDTVGFFRNFMHSLRFGL